MPEQDNFLYRLQDDLPPKFAADLLAQLHAQDAADIKVLAKPKRQLKPFSLLTVAILITLVLSGLIVVLRPTNALPYAAFEQLQPTFTQHGIISVENVDNLQKFASLGAGQVQNIALSPDESRLLVYGSAGMFLHDAQNLNAEPQALMPLDQPILDAQFVENGDIYGLYALDATTTVMFRWNQATGLTEELRRLPNARWEQRLHVRPDASQVAIAEYTELSTVNNQLQGQWRLHIYDETGAIQHELSADNYMVYTLSPDWQYLAYLETDKEVRLGLVHLLDLETGVDRVVLANALNTDLNVVSSIGRLLFSPDSQSLVVSAISTYSLYLTQVWSVERLLASETPLRPDMPRDSQNNAIPDQVLENMMPPRFSFAQNGQRIYNISSYELARYDLTQLDHSISENLPMVKRETLFSYNDFPQNGIITLDESILYFFGSGGAIERWNISTGQVVESFLGYNTPQLYTGLFFSPDSQALFLNSKLLRSWHLGQDQAEERYYFPNGDKTFMSNVHLSPDGQYLSYHDVFNSNGDIYIWEWQTDNAPIKLASRQSLHDLRFVGDNILIATTGTGTTFRWTPADWQVAEGELIRHETIRFDDANMYPYMTYPKSVDYSSDGRYAVLFDCENGQAPGWVGLCGASHLTLWDVATGERLNNVPTPENLVGHATFAFSPDDQIFAFSYCTEMLPEPDNYTCAKTNVAFYPVETLFTSPNPEPFLHLMDLDAVYSINFNPSVSAEGDYLVAMGRDYAPTDLYSLNQNGTWQWLRTVEGLNSGQFSPDGGLLVGIERTGRIGAWSVPMPSIVSR